MKIKWKWGSFINKNILQTSGINFNILSAIRSKSMRVPKLYSKEVEVQVYHEKVENLIQDLRNKEHTVKDKYLQEWVTNEFCKYEENF